MTITTVITELPPAPQRSDDPNDFIAKADAHVASLSLFVTELNQVTTEINQTVTDVTQLVNQAVLDAQTAATNSANSAIDAQNAATAAQSVANFEGSWSNLTGAYTAGISVEHQGAIWLLLNDVPNIQLSEPGVSNDWILATVANRAVPTPAILTFAAVNEFKASSTASVPAASDVQPDTFLDIYVAEKHKGITVTLNANGADVFDDGGNTDGQLVLSFPLGGYFRITSDGVSNLRV